MQTVMYAVAKAVTTLLTPVIPHTTEEIWTYLQEEEAYAQLAEFPEVVEYANTDELNTKWSAFMDFRSDVNKSLETAREEKVIGKSLQAKLHIFANEETKALLDSVGEELATYLMVSQLEIHDIAEASADATAYEGYSLAIEHAHGETCERCRAVKEEVGTIEAAPHLCARCANIVVNNYPEALVEEEA